MIMLIIIIMIITEPIWSCMHSPVMQYAQKKQFICKNATQTICKA